MEKMRYLLYTTICLFLLTFIVSIVLSTLSIYSNFLYSFEPKNEKSLFLKMKIRVLKVIQLNMVIL